MSENSEYANLLVYLDGEFVRWQDANIHVFSPAVKYGAAVFEGIRGYWNEDREKLYLFRLEDHMRRMELSQRIMRFNEIVPAQTMMDATIELMRRNVFRASVHIRPTVYVAGIGESSAQKPIGSFITAVVRATPKKVEVGCRAQISSWQRISDNVMPARAKANANYNNSRYAGIQALKDGYDAAILLNSRGKVSEGQGMCLFIIRNGVAVTPSVTSDILESITRDTVIHLLREQGVEVQERDVDRSEFFDASEAFFCGTGAEITPIIDVDGDAIGTGKPGDVTRQLQSLYFNLAYGRTDKRPEWLTVV
jgi:branched-chain amino acid aminotransferase